MGPCGRRVRVHAFFGRSQLGSDVIYARRDRPLVGIRWQQDVQPCLRSCGTAGNVEIVVEGQHDRSDLAPVRSSRLDECARLATP